MDYIYINYIIMINEIWHFVLFCKVLIIFGQCTDVIGRFGMLGMDQCIIKHVIIHCCIEDMILF